MSRIQSAAERKTKEQGDPFRLGWRTVPRRREDGTKYLEQVPLTEWDVLVDAREKKDGSTEVEVIGYQAGANAYERMPVDPTRGIWIPSVGMWFRLDGNRVRCLDRDGQLIPDRAELETRIREMMHPEAEADARAEREKKKAEQARKKTEREKKKAEDARALAKLEKARADAAEARIRELEAELKKSKKRPK